MKEPVKIPKKMTEAKELLVKIKKMSEGGLFMKSDRFVHNLHCSLLYGYILNTVGRLMMDALRITSGHNDYVVHAEVDSVGYFSMIVYKDGEVEHYLVYTQSFVALKVSAYMSNGNNAHGILYDFSDYVYFDFDKYLKILETYEGWLAPIIKETKPKKR
jgi:hypothetical protein